MIQQKTKTVAFCGSRMFMKYPDVRYFRRQLEDVGLNMVTAKSEDRASFIEEVVECSAIVVTGGRIDAEIIDALKHCELILALSVGYENVDVEAATAKGIPVCNIPTYCTEEVANHAITLLFSVTRRMKQLEQTVKNGEWTNAHARPTHTVEGRRLGIIGLGKIGRRVVPKARAFGMSVTAYDPYLADDIFGLVGVDRAQEMADLLSRVDYLSIHAPLTAETYHLIGPAELAMLKNDAVIINTARGGMVDEDALCMALRDGTIAGAGLDVLESEPPPPNHPLLDMDNVVVTPHVAWYSEESLHLSMDQGIQEVVGVLSGHRPRSIVNSQVLAKNR